MINLSKTCPTVEEADLIMVMAVNVIVATEQAKYSK